MISVNVIAYNEERNIERCLRSVSTIAGEIILVHDGPCADKTLEIARKYTKKIFIREHFGEAEPHRPFALSKSTKEWVLVLDADEYLSPKLQQEIVALTKNRSVDGYTFAWPFYDNGKKITKGPLSKGRRLNLFRRSAATHSGIFHHWYVVRGKIVDTDLVLEHNVPKDNWHLSGFMRKSYPRAQADARYRIMRKRARKPALFYLGLAVVVFVGLIGRDFFYFQGYRNGLLGLRMAFLNGLYNFWVYFFVFKYKLTGLPW